MTTDAVRDARVAVPATEPIRKAAGAPPDSPLRWPSGESVHVVHVAGELAPFARSGGLGEAVNSLARFQAACGLPTSIVMPLYDTARDNAPSIEPVGPAFSVQVGPRHETVRLWRLVSAPGRPARRGARLLHRERGVFRAAVHLRPARQRLSRQRAPIRLLHRWRRSQSLPRIAGKSPVLLHVHDWHTALAPVYLRTTLRRRRSSRVERKSCSPCTTRATRDTSRRRRWPTSDFRASLFNWRQLEWYGHVNVLKGGLVFADAATTVSPTHAHELRTAAGGFGLDGVFVHCAIDSSASRTGSISRSGIRRPIPCSPRRYSATNCKESSSAERHFSSRQACAPPTRCRSSR